MSYLSDAENFINSMPYRNGVYSGRNWGHSWHSLCSYHGKLKPSLAHFLVKNFTSEGDVVLDPLCGVGTIPFEACLQGRIGVGNDLSELAYVVTKAKVDAPSKDAALTELSILDEYIETHKGDYNGDEYANFGFNGKLPTYFHPDTYKEILAARQFFLDRIDGISSEQAMVYSAFLHVLHGNRPYALSRQSHPLTPYAPTGDFVYKSVVEKIRDKILINYKNLDLQDYTRGKSIRGDYNDLNRRLVKADSIICSPPFADSFRFYIQNWMRLWLCGWKPEDYKRADSVFLDNKQNKDFDVYKSFFEKCNHLLKDDGRMILHLGKTKKINMADELSERATEWFEIIYKAEEDVKELEKHGIADKGGTTEHQFLFLQKRSRK